MVTSKISFFAKQKTECPVCGATFVREELLTGRGRLVAGDLTEELRRKYEPSQKYGEVFPLIYPITVCPTCYFAAFPGDFFDIPGESKKKIEEESGKRLESIQRIFDSLDFRGQRTLNVGVASYYFAIMCYDYFPGEFSPVIKQGLSAIRAAWLCNDLHAKFPEENYEYLAKIFYRKARFFYTMAVEYEQEGKQGVSEAYHLGPDLDKNYGYDGVLYLAALLELHYGPREDEKRREEAIGVAKRTVARVFGMGKASKEKPSALLEKSKELYEIIGEELKTK